MKKTAVMILIVLFCLTSCTQRSKDCDIFEFSCRVNKSANAEIMDTDALSVDENNVIYWFPEKNKNACVSFYVNESTGNIEKCNIVFSDKKEDKELVLLTGEALKFNNPYMKKSEYKTEKYLMITYEDTRYKTENTKPTLKKEINEKDLY